jgi:Protein of unknown function (DUF1186)
MAMETSKILHQFERATGKFARAAVEAALARQEEITPEFLRILEETVDRAAQLDAEGDYMAHLYAMFLLAQFRETRAYSLVVRLAALPGDLLYSLCGDFITEDLGRVLASVCGGELAGIQSFENDATDEWVRGAALSGLVTLVAAGWKSRDEIVSYFAGLFRGKLVRKWSRVWDTLVSYSSDLYPEELLDDIKQAYEDGLVDPGYIGYQNGITNGIILPILLIIKTMVRKGGFEPPRLSAPPPQDGVSASSTTSAGSKLHVVNNLAMSASAGICDCTGLLHSTRPSGRSRFPSRTNPFSTASSRGCT